MAKNIIPLSTVDWYGRAVTVVFLMGCPFRCPYCQNYALLEMGKLTAEPADVEEIESEIEKNSLFMSGVVFTGGEPFHQTIALRSLAEFAHRQGLLVGVETNGYYTGRIRQMIEAHLVDLICMDVKAPLQRDAYLRICGIDAADHVADSLRLHDLCRESGIDFEVRTTVFPDLIGSPQEIRSIATQVRELAGDVRYILQQGMPEHAWRKMSPRSFTRDELMALARTAKPFLSDVRIRTREYGEERVN
jgi:pyruvate formate lyase activating enzyme